MLNHWQAIIWTNADLIHWHIYAALGGSDLVTCNLTGPKPLHELIMIYHKVDFRTNLTKTQKHPSWVECVKFPLIWVEPIMINQWWLKKVSCLWVTKEASTSMVTKFINWYPYKAKLFLMVNLQLGFILWSQVVQKPLYGDTFPKKITDKKASQAKMNLIQSSIYLIQKQGNIVFGLQTLLQILLHPTLLPNGKAVGIFQHLVLVINSHLTDSCYRFSTLWTSI